MFIIKIIKIKNNIIQYKNAFKCMRIIIDNRQKNTSVSSKTIEFDNSFF